MNYFSANGNCRETDCNIEIRNPEITVQGVCRYNETELICDWLEEGARLDMEL